MATDKDARLDLGPGLWFPLDAVTQPLAIMGVRRSGKSNAAAVLAEAMFDHDLPWVAIDPKGDWWGLRSNAAGTGPGLSIPIFGGLHGDMPLTPESGALMAELIFEHNLTCVLDVSRFTVAARSRFLVAFGDRLFELHQADPQPRHVFLEEAHRILPQQVRAEMAHCVGTWTKVIAEGGGFGLGISILDQRCATVTKDGLTQVEAMIALRTTSPQDRKAIHDWMVHHAIADDLTESLPSLASGEAWVSSSYWLPMHGQPGIQRARFRQRRTYDSGATPVVGQRRKAATIADVDLGAIEALMTSVTEQAAQNDPAALKRKVATLERQLAGAGPSPRVAELTAENADLRRQLTDALNRPPERIEVPVIADGDIPALQQALDRIGVALATAQAVAGAPAPTPVRPPATKLVPALEPRRDAPAPVASNGAAVVLPKAQRAILTVLAQFPERTQVQLAMLTGYSSKGGGFRNSLGALRTAGLIEKGDPIRATDAGIAALGGDWSALPAGQALLDHWVAQLPKAEGLILREVVAAYPNPIHKAEVAQATDYSPTGGGFRNALGKLRTLQLISGSDELIADETLAMEVAT